DAERCGSECDIAWLAGLLEGEGTFSINGIAENRYPRISVDMCSEPVIRRAAGILGSLSVRPREPRDERWRVTYFTAVTGARASEWMRRLAAHGGSTYCGDRCGARGIQAHPPRGSTANVRRARLW